MYLTNLTLIGAKFKSGYIFLVSDTTAPDGLYKMINEDNLKSVDKDQSRITLEKTGNENLINKIQTKHFTIKSILILLIALLLIHSLRIARFFYHYIKK